MSQENLERARQVMEIIGQRDADGLIALADTDVEWHSFFAYGGVYRGYEGTRQYMSDLADAWEIGRAEVDDVLAVGTVVLLVGRIHYRGKGSGVEGSSEAGWILKFREGKLTSFRAFREPERAVEAVGLSE